MSAAAWPQLRTERLVLRAHVTSDVPALFAMLADAETMPFWSTPPHTDDSGARGMAAERATGEDGSVRFAVERRADGVLLGTCSLFLLDRQSRRGEVGYLLGAHHRGRGCMHEALLALLDHGFTAPNVSRVEADVHPGDAASLRVLERLGFTVGGLLRERSIVNPEVSDSVVLGLLAREWPASGPAGSRPSGRVGG
jgi:RimJ/RimL family protein N-acetyltransferase